MGPDGRFHERQWKGRRHPRGGKGWRQDRMGKDGWNWKKWKHENREIKWNDVKMEQGQQAQPMQQEMKQELIFVKPETSSQSGNYQFSPRPPQIPQANLQSHLESGANPKIAVLLHSSQMAAPMPQLLQVNQQPIGQ